MRTSRLPISSLNEQTREIFSFLLDVNQSEQVGAVLRVAGGWVRDTLLGVPSHDIDIAIETVNTDKSALITGEVFTACIARYQASKALPTNTISVIKTNPEKSKHIETAQMTVMGFPLEFCHLRRDDYTAASRVPTVRPGTPLEDALRRDYTVNALFYNLHTEEVEDYTSGLEDMQSKLLRTPLKPLDTFLDDPLRLLRGIRFSGQLGYSLDREVIKCALNPELVSMIRDKVSRERIGIEFGKMMGGNNPILSAGLLIDTQLLHNTILQEVYYKKGKGKAVTNEIEAIRSVIPRTISVEEQAELDASLRLWTGNHLSFVIEVFNIPKGMDRVTLSCLAMLMPLALRGLLEDVAEESPSGPPGTVEERVTALVMMGLKQPSVIADNVTKMLRAVHMLLSAGDELLASMQTASASGSKHFVSGPHRELVFDVLCALTSKSMIEAGPLVALSFYLFAKGVSYADTKSLAERLQGDINLLHSPVSVVPLRGEDVSSSLGIEKKKTAAYILAQRRFLLHNPTVTREEIIEYLKSLAL